MSAGTYDFIIEQGSTFTRTITYTDSAGEAIDLTGYTARMQIRETKESNSVLAELTTENSGITIVGATGTITLLITAAVTAKMSFSKAYYDLELIDGAVVTRLIEGTVKNSRETTR